MNEILLRETPGLTNLYCIIEEHSTQKIWDGDSFETTPAAWGDCHIPYTEHSFIGGKYHATFPAAIGAGIYNIYSYQGNPPASTDTLIGFTQKYWDAAALLDPASVHYFATTTADTLTLGRLAVTSQDFLPAVEITNNNMGGEAITIKANGEGGSGIGIRADGWPVSIIGNSGVGVYGIGDISFSHWYGQWAANALDATNLAENVESVAGGFIQATINSATDNQTFTITGSQLSGSYKDAVVVIEHVSGGVKEFRYVKHYDEPSKTVTLNRPLGFMPADGDKIHLVNYLWRSRVTA